jgi:hypothetical protein
MPYTLGFSLFDLGGFHASSLPTLIGVLDDFPSLAGPSTATATPASFSLTFTDRSNPPGRPGTLHVTDPSGPGDFFRSGPLAVWPREPVVVAAGTALVRLTYADLTAGVAAPIDIDIDGGIGALVGFTNGFMFSPRKIRLTSVVVGPSATPGAVRARFSGVIEYFTPFIPRRTDLTGSVDLTLTPSGNVVATATIVNVSASNLRLTPSLTTPLSTAGLVILSPLFSGALSGPLTTRVNSAMAPVVAAARMMVPLTPAGTPLFSAAATVSVRRITPATSGVTVQAILSELVPAPSIVRPPVDQPASPRLAVTIDPTPELDVAQTYVIRVRDQATLAPVDAATITIVTYAPITGANSTITTQTNGQGLAAVDVTLGARVRPSTDPTHTGQLDVTPPSLTVVKAGFDTYRQDLS